MKSRLWLVFAFFLITTSARADTPVNLIPNGNFATSLDGWTCNGTCSWTSQGASEDGTGAIDIPGGGASLLDSSCFAIQPQTVYDVSFDAWANVGPIGGDFNLFCWAYTDSDCTSATGDFSYMPLPYFGMGWQGTQGQHVSGATGRYAMCEVNFSAHGAEMRMDNFVFAFDHPLDGIYADGFEVTP